MSDIPSFDPGNEASRPAVASERPATFAEIAEADERVAELDPLKADEFLTKTLPALNEAGDLDGIVQQASQFIPTEERVAGMNNEEAAAAKRDLAFMAASLRRHTRSSDRNQDLAREEASPVVRLVPGLEERMLQLAQMLDEPPSLTVNDYVTRNPDEGTGRERTFTGRESEVKFILSIRIPMQSLPRCVDNLIEAQQLAGDMERGLNDPEYSRLVEAAVAAFQPMIEETVRVRREVSEQEFSDYIRKYFDPEVIGGQFWNTASAAQTLMLEVDRAAWSGDISDPMLREHFDRNVIYQPAVIRKLAEGVQGRQSLVGAAVRQAQEGKVDLTDPTVQQSLASLERLLLNIRKFRFPHGEIVERNKEYRESVGESAVGSGGETIDTVMYLRDRTDEEWKRVRDLVVAGRGS